MISWLKRKLVPDFRDQFRGAADRMLEIQDSTGAIAWYENGPFDPWNHTECAMALHVMEETKAAEAAFAALWDRQKDDGSWLAEYGSAVPMADKTHMARDGAPAYHDTNFAAYCAVGVWHEFLLSGNRDRLEQHWPRVASAIEFVLRHQSDDGDIAWSAESGVSEPDDAFRAGNSSIYKSLACAIRIATEFDGPVARWIAAREDLGHALRTKPHRFDRARTDRSVFAMDWYYPILSGALGSDDANARLADEWGTFVEPGRGCRCVSTEPWITVAETCELVMALLTLGKRDLAEDLFKTQLGYTNDRGAFWMGWQFEQEAFWPEELPSWTQGAVILAADALYGDTPASRLLVEHAM